MNQIMSIKELSLYLGIKEKTLYAKVAAKEIPHYKIDRLVRFKIEEIDLWMEDKKVVPISVDPRSKNIFKNMMRRNLDIKSVVKNAIEEFKDKRI